MSNPDTETMHPWYSIPSTVVSVASWAVDVHALDTPQAVVDFFEKPHNYPELYEQFLAHEDDES